MFTFSNLLRSVFAVEQNLDRNSPDSGSKMPSLPLCHHCFGGSNTCQPVHLSGFCWRMLCSCGYKLPFSPYHLIIWTPKPRFKAWLRFSPLGPICTRKKKTFKQRHCVVLCPSRFFLNMVIFFRKQSGFQAFFQGILFCCFADVYLFMS